MFEIPLAFRFTHPRELIWEGNWQMYLQTISSKTLFLPFSLLHIPRARFSGCRAIGSANGRMDGV